MLCVLGTGVAAADPAPPAERDALAQQVKKFHDAKNCDGILGLFYTEGVDSQRKEALTRTVKETLCANFGKKINSVAFQSIRPDKAGTPGDFEGRHSAYTLEPLGVLVVDYGMGKPRETRSLAYRYGVHDDKAYLVTTKNADAK
jgi:hypothetical protein